MAFQLPAVDTSAHPVRGLHSNEDTLVHALHAAFHSFGSHHDSVPHTPQELDTSPTHAKDKSQAHMSLDIAVSSDRLSLKGTGLDVEPAILSGHVVLYLTEHTSIKEITLQFRGKARMPPGPNEQNLMNTSPSVYVVCNHEWSFLEGTKNHSHTLKPGRHLFPFELRIGGSLPSTISNGDASVSYKLRAVAIRPGLVSNLSAIRPIVIIRSFTSEALEYQQTLEIENTWPGKLMYSIMLPHKAWAAGDDLVSLVKFAPMAKGVRVVTVTTSINETTKTYSRSGYSENTRSVFQVKHDIVGGKAVSIHGNHRLRQLLHQDSHGQPPQSSSMPLRTPHRNSGDGDYFSGNSGLPSGMSTPIGDSPSPRSPENGLSPSAESAPCDHEDPNRSEDEVVTQIVVPIPKMITPTHALEPIIVTHRVRWCIHIRNSDGHISELRCSLPLHILDHALLEEAKTATSVTRRLMLGLAESTEPADDMELPSYPAHVRDRVANVYLPDSATLRITNPWVRDQVDPLTATSAGRQGSCSHDPLELHQRHSPHATPSPDSGTSTPLEWANSELLLSLGPQPPASPAPDGSTRSPPGSNEGSSQPGSRRQSRRASRASSRAASPERGGADETHVHAHGAASRQPHGLFHMSMKPLTGLVHPWSSHSASRAHTPLAHASGADTHRVATHAGGAAPTSVDAGSSAALLHRAFTEVPDYNMASRGFLGGGAPPLESMRGLPSYEEARSASESNLAAHFSRSRLQQMRRDADASAH